jgi:hypothetical protein
MMTMVVEVMILAAAMTLAVISDPGFGRDVFVFLFRLSDGGPEFMM